MGATIKDSARRGDSNRAGMGAEATGGIGYGTTVRVRLGLRPPSTPFNGLRLPGPWLHLPWREMQWPWC
jgi:hypothetical protein